MQAEQGNIMLPKRAMIGDSCRSMATEMMNGYLQATRNPDNSKVASDKVLEIALKQMELFIKSTRGEDKIIHSHDSNPEIVRSAQMICEIMKRYTAGNERYKFEYNEGVGTRSTYTEKYSPSALTATLKALERINPSFREALNPHSAVIKEVERSQLIEKTTFKATTTANEVHKGEERINTSRGPGRPH
jgi:hypothetical protein